MTRHRFGQPQARLSALPHGVGEGASAGWLGHLALVWLVLALVATPTLGRLHQVVHGGVLDRLHTHGGAELAQGAPQAFTQADAPADATTLTTSGKHAHGGLLAQLVQLVVGHAPTACLLVDQLALGDALHSPHLALPEAASVQAQPCLPVGRATLPHTPLFLARGPPVVA